MKKTLQKLIQRIGNITKRFILWLCLMFASLIVFPFYAVSLLISVIIASVATGWASGPVFISYMATVARSLGQK